MIKWITSNWDILFSGIGTLVVTLIITNIKEIRRLFKNKNQNTRLVQGKWLTKFSYEENGTNEIFTEVIEIKSTWGKYKGHIEPDDRNYERLKMVHETKPIRIEGTFFENKLLSGVWFHPIEKNRWIGTFQVSLTSNDEFNGVWTGFSETKKKIVSGEWSWIKIK